MRHLMAVHLLAWLLAAPTAFAAEVTLAHWPGAAARSLTADDLHVTVLRPVDVSDVDGPLVEEALDLGRHEDLVRLRERLTALGRLAENQAAARDAHPERVAPFAYDLSTRGKRRAIEEMVVLADALVQDTGQDPHRRGETAYQLLELFHAVHNGFRYPVKRSYQIVPEILPILLVKMGTRESVPREGTPEPDHAPEPKPSSFWHDRGDIAKKDLYAGFGREALPSHDVVCQYREPKTGWGAHPGFDLECGDQDLEFKLGDEIYGGPFNTRIFHALGYNTFPIDRVDGLKLAYDRRVFTQFHSRRRLAMQAKLLFIPVLTRVVTDQSSPFEHIEAAVMKDGRTLSAAELEAALLKGARPTKEQARPYTQDANFDPAVESAIAYLVWKPGTVAYEGGGIRNVGPWDYDQLDHQDRPEVRAVLVLSAWLDQYNMRWENTRVAYAEQDGRREVRHLFSDVGSGMGVARSLLKTANSDVEAMLWEVTESVHDGVRFTWFTPNVRNDAFQHTTWDDARWMLRRIAQLSEKQILGGLLATGMSAAEVRLALEKLVSKRRDLLEDFILTDEFPEIVRRRIDRTLNFDPGDPAQLAAVTLTRPDGGKVAPPVGNLVVRDGHLVTRTVPGTMAGPPRRPAVAGRR